MYRWIVWKWALLPWNYSRSVLRSKLSTILSVYLLLNWLNMSNTSCYLFYFILSLIRGVWWVKSSTLACSIIWRCAIKSSLSHLIPCWYSHILVVRSDLFIHLRLPLFLLNWVGKILLAFIRNMLSWGHIWRKLSGCGSSSHGWSRVRAIFTMKSNLSIRLFIFVATLEIFRWACLQRWARSHSVQFNCTVLHLRLKWRIFLVFCFIMSCIWLSSLVLFIKLGRWDFHQWLYRSSSLIQWL